MQPPSIRRRQQRRHRCLISIRTIDINFLPKDRSRLLSTVVVDPDQRYPNAVELVKALQKAFKPGQWAQPGSGSSGEPTDRRGEFPSGKEVVHSYKMEK